VSRLPQETDSKRAAPADTVPIPRPRSFELSPSDQQRLDELNERAGALLREERYRDALGIAQEALEITEVELPRDHPSRIQPLWILGQAHHAVADYSAVAAGRIGDVMSAWRDASEYFEAALRLAERHRGPHHPDVAALADGLGDVYASLHRYARALDMKQRVLAIVKTTEGANSRAALKAANDLEVLRIEKLIAPRFQKELSKALPLALAQIRNAGVTLGPDHVNVARGSSALASILGSSEAGVRTAALPLLERALALYTSGRSSRLQAIQTRAAIARLYVESRQYAKAEGMFDLVTGAAEQVLGPSDAAVIRLWSERGQALQKAGQYDKAAAAFTRVLSFWDERLQIDPSAIHRVREALEDLGDTWRSMREYHSVLAVALALAPLAVEPSQEHAFITQFLSQWGGAETGKRVRRRARG
jgi:tetratricopeptide (TPR) repeat protein